MKPSRVFLMCACSLVLGGCKGPVASGSYIGVASNRADWPYRYRISQSADGWSGSVDCRVEGGWLPWDRMEITKQDSREIDFRALLGVPGKALPFNWHLTLGEIGAAGFRGKLTGEAFENRVDDLDTTPIEIEFKRSAE